MAKRYKATTTPAPLEAVLGAVAAAVWFITQGASWLRLLVAGVGLALALVVAHTALAPARGAASTWGPHSTTVVSPARVPTAAPAVVHV